MRSTTKCRRRSSLALIAVCCASLVACNNEVPVGLQEEASGEISIQISLAKVVQSQISRAEVVVSGSGMSDITAELSANGASWSGTVVGIPAGADRLFTLNTYDAGGSLNYTGSALADIVAGEKARVEVTLRSVSGPVGGPSLEVRGSPLITQGGTDYGWSASLIGEDARIAGEIENKGTIAAENVRVTVTLRDPNGNLLGRVRDHVIGTIRPGDSELFEVFIEDVFSDFEVNTSSYEVEVDISSD